MLWPLVIIIISITIFFKKKKRQRFDLISPSRSTAYKWIFKWQNFIQIFSNYIKILQNQLKAENQYKGPNETQFHVRYFNAMKQVDDNIFKQRNETINTAY